MAGLEDTVGTMDHKITALTLQKRNRQRVNVYLDGEFAFGLARIVAAWLHEGQELSDEKIAQLRLEDAREVAHQQALKLIQYRPRSEAEIRQNLTQHKISPENIELTIQRLRDGGLINDAQFAQAWVENRADLRPRSRRALAFELSQRGIDRQLIDSALEELDDDELAYQAAVRRAPKFETLEWKDFRLKMIRYLAQRGFNYDASAQAVARVWEELDSQRSSPGEERSL
jgi:regulatory protein